MAERTRERTACLPQGVGLRQDGRAAESYRDRIRLLQLNPLIANSPFEHTNTFMVDAEAWQRRYPEMASCRTLTFEEKANCFGTTAWVLGIERQIEQVWREAIRNGRSFEANGTGDHMTLADDDRPGYVGAEPMRAFLRFSPNVELVKAEGEGVIFTQWYADPHAEVFGFEIKHSAILLPNMLLFEKEGYERGIRSDRDMDDLLACIPSDARKAHTWFFRVNGIS